MIASELIPQATDRGLVEPSQRQHFRDGVSQFIDAIHRVARVHPIHQSIIVTIDQQLVRICSCGWTSLPVVSYALAEQTECPVWLAEIERHVRANRRGADVIAALEVLISEAAVNPPGGSGGVRHGQ